MRRSAAVLLAGLLAAPLALGACGDDDGAVALTFRPAEGSELHYEMTIESTTSTDLPCPATEQRTDRTTLQTTQRVLDVDDNGARVEVALSRPGIGTRTVVVRFDRAAQLTAVEEIEGIDADALGELGLSEVFPAAAGAPPDRPLAPGDRWAIDADVQLDADGEPARLQGEGRLAALGVEDGTETATVESTTLLPVATSAASAEGSRSLDGEQVTEVTATYDLRDGTVRRAESVTTGAFTLELGPPPGGGGDPCVGTLDLEVRSEVSRRG